MVKLLQLNANHSWVVQDMLDQLAIEENADLSLITEPRFVPESPLWFGSRDSKAAIKWRPTRGALPCNPCFTCFRLLFGCREIWELTHRVGLLVPERGSGRVPGDLKGAQAHHG